MYLGSKKFRIVNAVDDNQIFASRLDPQSTLAVTQNTLTMNTTAPGLTSELKPVTVSENTNTQTPTPPQADKLAPAVSTTQTLAASDETIQKLKDELDRMVAQNNTYRGRILSLLGVLRGKNKTIARQRREIEALTQQNPLTVDAILNVAVEPVAGD